MNREKKEEEVYSVLFIYFYSATSATATSDFCIRVMQSPFNKIRPISVLAPVLMLTSLAWSSVMFMYSSKPMIWPSILILVSSNNQIVIRVFS